MNDITSAIQQKIVEFGAALRTGKLEWTAAELVQYVPEPKDSQDAATLFPGLGLGPTAPARAALCARLLSGALGIDLESRGGTYTFSAPTSNANGVIPEVKVIEKRVEVPVEKIVYRDRAPAKGDDNLEAPVKFPELPLEGKANPNYVTPAWYRRMKAALEAGKHVAIAGPPGGGKSTGPEQYFIAKGQPFVTVNGDAGFRRKDMEGSVEVKNGATFFRVAEFAAAAVNGWGCILNEVNAADPDALMYINGLLEVPFVVNIHGKAYPVHKDFRLIVTYNPGLVGTKALPQAFKDRFFPIKLDFPPRDFVRKMIVAKTGVSPTAAYLDRLLKYSADCWALHVKGNLRYQISPRRLFDVVFLMESGACQDLTDAIKQAVVDAVDSAADAEMLKRLVTTPLAEVGPVSQFGVQAG